MFDEADLRLTMDDSKIKIKIKNTKTLAYSGEHIGHCYLVWMTLQFCLK